MPTPIIKLGQGDYEREYHAADVDWSTPTRVDQLWWAIIGLIAGWML